MRTESDTKVRLMTLTLLLQHTSGLNHSIIWQHISSHAVIQKNIRLSVRLLQEEHPNTGLYASPIEQAHVSTQMHITQSSQKSILSQRVSVSSKSKPQTCSTSWVWLDTQLSVMFLTPLANTCPSLAMSNHVDQTAIPKTYGQSLLSANSTR